MVTSAAGSCRIIDTVISPAYTAFFSEVVQVTSFGYEEAVGRENASAAADLEAVVGFSPTVELEAVAEEVVVGDEEFDVVAEAFAGEFVLAVPDVAEVVAKVVVPVEFADIADNNHGVAAEVFEHFVALDVEEEAVVAGDFGKQVVGVVLAEEEVVAAVEIVAKQTLVHRVIVDK
ncbi:unnamed protein product [Litomosoides sigmodontis]|uniref:Uncharacterized protein n=1 Tax=Litomosoides sigmodontis TaxID=42156 RepID=A0A3P6T204_LITSI|nr:unnamed protein product [Litomosoides sigmodontis]